MPRSPKPRNIPCSFPRCPRLFTNRAGLTNHIRSVHRNHGLLQDRTHTQITAEIRNSDHQTAAATATNSSNANTAMKTNGDESDSDNTVLNSPLKARAAVNPEPALDEMTAKALKAAAKSLSDATIALKNATDSLSFATRCLLSGRL